VLALLRGNVAHPVALLTGGRALLSHSHVRLEGGHLQKLATKLVRRELVVGIRWQSDGPTIRLPGGFFVFRPGRHEGLLICGWVGWYVLSYEKPSKGTWHIRCAMCILSYKKPSKGTWHIRCAMCSLSYKKPSKGT
jgi:hypothetical protein